MQFSVDRADELDIEAGEPLASMYRLSPYVWSEDGRYDLALRAVNRDDDPSKKIARIYHGCSDDGRRFAMDDHPAVAPGPDKADAGGCEDPSVAKHEGVYYVFYSGYDAVARETTLRLATGPSMHALAKRGAVFQSDRYRNAKEATVVQAFDGTWRMFFEFAEDDRSKIGLAVARTLSGPWTFRRFDMPAREGYWDDWHLSPGPVVEIATGKTVMFYNGATKKPAWRVGWIELDRDCLTIERRCESYVIEPGSAKPGATDIAFAASALTERDGVVLYYSISDETLMRARLRLRG